MQNLNFKIFSSEIQRHGHDIISMILVQLGNVDVKVDTESQSMSFENEEPVGVMKSPTPKWDI